MTSYSSFSLFECRKVVTGSKSPQPGSGTYLSFCYLTNAFFYKYTIQGNHFRCTCFAEEYIGLDDNRYIGDLLAEFKALKDRSKGEILNCKLIFKKKLFRESDEAVTDPMFIQLSYVQVSFLVLFLSMASSKFHRKGLR